MKSSARNIFPSLQLRPTSFVKPLSILGIFIVVISYSYWSHLVNIQGVFTDLKPTPAQTRPGKLADHGWTQNIWQTSKYPAQNISSENEKYIKTWTDLNPGYHHKLLTDGMITEYVRDHFHARNPDIEETFLQAEDFVLQLDLIKYMVLWAEGGVFSDLDVACVQPFSRWVPPQFMDKAGIVLGVQVEQKAGLAGNAKDSFQLADWTIMSKPNQPFLWFLYQRLTENIKHLAAEHTVPALNIRPYNISDVTGRNALTQAFLAYASSVTATKVTVNNFTKVTEPTLFGEILVLPVQAFASSHPNGKELVHHYEAGSWKSEPWDKLQPSVGEEQKKKGPQEKEIAEEEKNMEAETQEHEDMQTTGGDQNSEQDKKEGVSEEKGPSPAGNSTSSADMSTKGKVGQTSVNGTAEPSKPPVEAKKASPADENKPTSDTPPSIQYENAQAKDKPTTNNKPPSVQYENVKVAENATGSKHNTSNSAPQHLTNDNTNTKGATDKDTVTKAEETKAKEEAEKLKTQPAVQTLEQEKKNAAAKKAAEAKKIADAQKKEEEEKRAAEAKKKEEEEEEKKKAAEAQKKKEEEQRLAEEEEQKKKTAEPKWAPLNEAGKLVSSNNLADYGAEFVPPE